MVTKQITLQIDENAVNAYEGAPREVQKKLDALMSIRLIEATKENKSLRDVMDEMGEKARMRGLTPEILESILNEKQ